MKFDLLKSWFWEINEGFSISVERQRWWCKKLKREWRFLLGRSQTPATSPHRVSDKSLCPLNSSSSSSFFGFGCYCCFVRMLGFLCLTNYFCFLLLGFSKPCLLLICFWYIWWIFRFWDNLLGYLFQILWDCCSVDLELFGLVFIMASCAKL